MPRALVLGVNGQDGSYLAESLLLRGYQVSGIGRQSQSRYTPIGPLFRYVNLDLASQESLRALVSEFRPDIAFHVAAIHGSAGYIYESLFAEMMKVNTDALHVLLEHARLENPKFQIVYASSLKIFPQPYVGKISEASPYRPTCLYSISKIASMELISYYRQKHGTIGSNLILFNHESTRRGPSYFVPTIARALSAAMADPAAKTEIQTLDFWIDWSAADELMDIAVDIAEKAPDTDYIVASGKTWHAREAVAEIFARRHLDYRNHLIERSPKSDPGAPYLASIERLSRAIGRRPVKTIFDIVDSISASQS
jgi:GDPmannose 4,6-dehydratase